MLARPLVFPKGHAYAHALSKMKFMKNYFILNVIYTYLKLYLINFNS